MAERKPRNPAKTAPVPKELRAELDASKEEVDAAWAARAEADRRLNDARARAQVAQSAVDDFLWKGDEGLPTIIHKGQTLVLISRTAGVLVTRPAGSAGPVRRWKWNAWSKAFIGKRPCRWGQTPEIPVSAVDAVFPLAEVSDGR